MRGLVYAVATAGGVAVVSHLAPGVVTWRALRVRFTPRLAGIGRPDHVALSFDDGPDPLSTPVILDELDRLGWKATFFLLGTMVRAAPSLAGELVVRGHEVAVHGDRHANHLLKPATWTVADVGRAKAAITEATGVTPRWFRPPYGALSASSLMAARRHQLETMLWTTWGRDWRATATPETVTTEVLRACLPGATVLLHDSDCTSAPGSWRAALGSLGRLAEIWDQRDLTVGPLGEHFDRPSTALDAGTAAGKT